MKTKRNFPFYLTMMTAIMALGLPARLIQDRLPAWYTLYFGDYLWAMLLFFMFALMLRNTGTFKVAVITLSFTYLVEISQLFQPGWLEYLRSIKLFALVLGYGFLWSDIIAYTFGVLTAASMDRFFSQVDPGKV
jgi:hypothetical protein